MNASTTSTNTTCKIILHRINPDLGPDLKCRIFINNRNIDTFLLNDQKICEYEIQVNQSDNYLDIEHYDRNNSNTRTDDKGNVIRTSMILIKDIKINDVKFYATSTHSENKFIPAYDDSYLEWARKNEPGKNFPDEVKANPNIGINGKFRLHFKWPLHLHGMYYRYFSGILS